MSIFVFLSLILVLKRLKIKSTLCNNKKWVNGNHRYWSHSLIICTGSITSLIKKNTCKFKLNRTDSLSPLFDNTNEKTRWKIFFIRFQRYIIYHFHYWYYYHLFGETREEKRKEASLQNFSRFRFDIFSTLVNNNELLNYNRHW